MMKKIVLPGGSGFLGDSLATYLIQRGYEPVILTRGSSTIKNGISYVQWDGRSAGEWMKEIDGSEAVINFTGKSVHCLYTPSNKAEILSSRLDSVSILQDAINKCSTPPRVFVQAGSLAIYGNTTHVCDEQAPHGSGFSVEVCEKWEETFFSTEFHQTRLVMLRIGFALDQIGGALEPLRMLVKMNLGGTIGSGKQFISWIHMNDLNAMFLKAIENDNISGIYNACSPHPVTNKEFMATLRKTLKKGWALPAPTPLVTLGAYLIMRASPELALTGRNCIPAKFTQAGFMFQYKHLDEALKDLAASDAIAT